MQKGSIAKIKTMVENSYIGNSISQGGYLMRYVRQPEATLRIHHINSVLLAVLCAGGIFSWGAASAGESEDPVEMQKQLNQGVMEKPFSVEDAAKIDAYITDAMKKDIKPQQTPPASWRSGYTCADLQDYYEYRDCLYYYRYYGHYW